MVARTSSKAAQKRHHRHERNTAAEADKNTLGVAWVLIGSCRKGKAWKLQDRDRGKREGQRVPKPRRAFDGNGGNRAGGVEVRLDEKRRPDNTNKLYVPRLAVHTTADGRGDTSTAQLNGPCV